MTRAARIAALLMLFATAAYALERFALHPLRCSRAATRGAFALQQQRRDFAQRQLAERIRTELRDCTCTAQELHTRARASAITGNHDAAISDYRRALELDRRPETYFALAMSQLETLDRAGAIASLVRACAFDPTRLDDIPHADVRAEIERHLRVTPGKPHLP